MTNLIGLVGPKGSGKSTLAKTLVPDYTRAPFAFPLKAMLRTLLQIQGASNVEIYSYLEGEQKESPCSYLAGKTPRHAMQTLGTEWRDMIDPCLWLIAWAAYVDKNCSQIKIVVEDVRFLHEAKLIRTRGGKLVNVFRPGHGPGQHLSEQEYLEINTDFTVVNDGTKSDLFEKFNRGLSTLEKENG